jgi:hypothetical protein
MVKIAARMVIVAVYGFVLWVIFDAPMYFAAGVGLIVSYLAIPEKSL